MLVDTSSSTGSAPPTKGPGKTGPRLFSDILTYNPYNNGINVLAHLPPEHNPSARANYERSGHTHRFILKPLQSTGRSFPIEPGATHIIAAVCHDCRKHVEVALHYGDTTVSSTCPSTYNLLHHFRYDPHRSGPFINKDRKEESSGEIYVRCFDCTNPGCKTSVTVTFRHRRITDTFRALLTDSKTLYNRNREAVEKHPERFLDPKPGEENPRPIARGTPTPAQVLKTMRQVIGGVTARKERRNIPRFNPRFMTQLGDECYEMMALLGFSMEGEELVPPVLPEEPGKGVPLQNEAARIFDDWDHELLILIALNDIDSSLFQPLMADSDLKKLLGCSTYDTNGRRTMIDLTQIEHPMYASLGAQSDFADSLLFWSYKRQKECDPENAAYYFECITDLANGRKSEELQLEVVTLRSQGEISSADIRNAYRNLGITYNHKDENYIIGNFHSRLSDAPRQEAALKESLAIIGRVLKNQTIINISEKVTMDLTQAYAKLGVPADVDSDFVQNLFHFNLNESPNDAANIWAALRVIADARKDPKLLSMCDAHDKGLEIMDYETALARLGVNEYMAEDTMVAYYEAKVTPNSLTTLKSALKVIADRRQSRPLLHYVETGSKKLFTDGMADWPVGLDNMGNTCYLNSLLQSYFTIKPLRECILEFEKYEEDEITEELLNRKQVGGRKLTQFEIERGKQIAYMLKDLFKDMVTSRQTSVRYNRGLPNMILNPSEDPLSPANKERPGISTDPDRPLGFIGPLLPPITHQDEPLPFEMEIDDKPVNQHLRVNSTGDDQSSDGTLVGDGQEPPAYEDQGFVVVDGQQPVPVSGKNENGGTASVVENLERQAEKTVISPVSSTTRGLSSMDNMSLDDESVPLLQKEDESMEDAPSVPDQDGLRAVPPIPERPPPVPPRPKEKKQEVEIQTTSYGFGRQQDVTECIVNMMFLLEAALKATEVAPDGEQIDIIKRLFYGKTMQALEPVADASGQVKARYKEERFATVMVDVGETGKDIYTALDGHFDASMVELEGKPARRYLSISELPSLLQIQVQRVQFNSKTKQAYKSNAPLKFSERIFLDRYMAPEFDDKLMARREMSWEWKAKLEVLEKRKTELEVKVAELTLPEALETTRMYLDEINQILGDEDEDMVVVPSGLLLELENHQEKIKEELKQIDLDIKELQSQLNQQFTDLRKYGYRIHSVFIHSGGGVISGHYWVNIYDYDAGCWRKYNDNSVIKLANEEQLFKEWTEQSSDQMSPYFLVYVREDKIDQMQAICRDLSGDDGFVEATGTGAGRDRMQIDDGRKGG